jgi:glycolate oxidase iron-sulfur subunit
MQTKIHAELTNEPGVSEANDILRACVHCGFCNATCPTYQLLGDELDGPRGRIYLIKNLLEGNRIDDKSVSHLDRCLTCRSCETTCPSGVQYGRLLDIGRGLVAERTTRPLSKRIISSLLRLVVPRHYLFKPLLTIGQFFSPVLPTFISRMIPPKQQSIGALTTEKQVEESGKSVLILHGCVQKAATPGVNQALEDLLALKGVDVLSLQDEGCCGALEYHLSAHEQGLERMRHLIDKLHERLPQIDHIVSSASGCGVTIKEYPLHLANDPEYLDKAKAVVSKVVDVAELLSEFEFECSPKKVAVHTPCSLLHGQKLSGMVEKVLKKSGMTIVESRESHLCCGSAGTYSILQPKLSGRLLTRKLEVLEENSPEVIVTANIGCQLHLQSEADTRVMHWVELIHKQLV